MSVTAEMAGKSETKEERKAREAAAKLAKLAKTTEAEHTATSTVDSISGTIAVKIETKGERKARRKAEKLVASSTTGHNTQDDALPEAGPSRATQSLAGPSITPASNNPADATVKKDKKDKKRKRQGEEAPPVAGISSISTAPGENVGSAKEVKPAKRDKKDNSKRDKQEVETEETTAGPETVASGSGSTAPAQGTGHRKKAYSSSQPVEAVSSGSESILADLTLSDQGKKALHYVRLYTSVKSPAATNPAPGEVWKFHKAKQNWLMRNVWSDTEIPDTYLEGVLSYLKTIQGTSRQALIDDAKRLLIGDAASAADDTAARDDGVVEPGTEGIQAVAKVEGTSTVESGVDESKQDRARIVLTALGAT